MRLLKTTVSSLEKLREEENMKAVFLSVDSVDTKGGLHKRKLNKSSAFCFSECWGTLFINLSFIGQRKILK